MYEIEQFYNGKIHSTTIACGHINKYTLIRFFYIVLGNYYIDKIEKYNISFKIVTSNTRKIIKEFSSKELIDKYIMDDIIFATYNTDAECNRHFICL